MSVAASESTLPKLSAAQCTKLRHLTIVTLAIKNKVSYDSCMHFIFTFNKFVITVLLCMLWKLVHRF